MDPLVSIIVPVYNVEKYICKCLDSLLNQNYSNFEVILIDDGSTDNSGKICDYYSKKHNNIRVFHLDNKGVSNARNYGIEKAKGDFIQFVDSDDFVNKNYINDMIKLIDSEEIDMIICGINQVNYNQGESVSSNIIVSKNEGLYRKNNLKYVIEDLIESSYINYCYSKLIRRNLLKENKIEFKKNISLGEDTLFILDVLKNSRSIRVVSEAPYNYVIHSNQSLTYKYRKDKFDILNNLSNEIYKFCDEEQILNEKLTYILDKRYLGIIRFCLDENFKRYKGIRINHKLKNMKKILTNKDVVMFINSNKELFEEYPKLIIEAIRLKNVYIYCFVYYFMILKSKLRI